MKILQLVYAFYPYSGSGNSRVAFEISKELVRRGHEVTVCTTNVLERDTMFTPKKDEYILNGIKVHYHKNLFYKPNKIMPLFFSQGVVNEIRKIEDYDIIHLHENRFYTSVILHHFAKKYNVPYVLQAHGDLTRAFGKQKLKGLYDIFFAHRVFNDASKVIALNEVEAEQYKAVGVPDEKIVVIPNGIDLSGYENLPPPGHFKNRFHIDKGDKVLLFVGRINKIKGIDILLKAFSKLAENLGNIKLAIVGPDDGYLSEIETLAETLKINDKVLILGPLYGREKLAAFVDSEFCVLPSRYEIWGMVVLEAYACGKPVIASRVDGLEDLIQEGYTGFLFEPENVEELAECMNYLLNDGKNNELGLNCKKIVSQRYALEKIVEKLVLTYKQIIRNQT